MPTTIGRKTKIVLADYPYKKDIENRLFLSNLSEFEVTVLQEILSNSLKIPISDLESLLGTKQPELIKILDKFSKTGLLCRQKDAIFVDKEMRKYFEFHIQKFDDDYIPDLEYLGGLLGRLPLSLLPTWYNIPKTTDNIFASIIEKFFATPKLYERHLKELSFADPTLDGIIADLYSSPTLMLRVDDIKSRYKLSREKLEEVILDLELHLVLVLSYKKINNRWKGVVTPFREWRDFLLFEANTLPKSISESKTIQRKSPDDFAYLGDLITHIKNNPTAADLEKLDELSAKSFLALPLQDQAILLYRNALTTLPMHPGTNIEFAERSFREVEKSLRRILHLKWVYFDDFMKGVIAHIGSLDGVVLRKMGTRYRYVIPTYTEKEVTFIKSVIFDSLYQAGIVATGTESGKPCFCVTNFGKVALGE
jgi:predicted transcriptional regulator